jgi:hypothetical protein
VADACQVLLDGTVRFFMHVSVWACFAVLAVGARYLRDDSFELASMPLGLHKLPAVLNIATGLGLQNITAQLKPTQDLHAHTHFLSVRCISAMFLLFAPPGCARRVFGAQAAQH